MSFRRQASQIATLGVALAIGVVAGAAEVAAPAGGGAAAMRLHVDPRTGRPVPPPAVPEAGETRPPRSGDDLVERPAPEGGVVVHLPPDRFRSPLVATVRPGGGVRVEHGPAGRDGP